jgi:hypothetical protein
MIIDLSQLSSGTYTLTFVDDGLMDGRKVVVTRE